MDQDILLRIQQLTAAFGKGFRRDLCAFPARIQRTEKSQLVVQDFSGGASEAELANVMQSILINLGSFHDHLKAWAERRGISGESIHNYLRRSFDVCVIMDLYNREKHVNLTREGWSGRKPSLGRVRGVLQMRTRPQKNSSIAITMGSRGQHVASGDGTAEVVVTAEVKDKNGNGMGDVDQYVRKSIQHFENALRDFNVRQP